MPTLSEDIVLKEKITQAIHLASIQDNIEYIQTLNELIAPHPEKIRAMHQDGLFTPLHLACSLNVPACVATILSALTPEMLVICDADGKTPFFYAQNPEVLSLLIEKLTSVTA